MDETVSVALTIIGFRQGGNAAGAQEADFGAPDLAQQDA
jgi:hypothetical protein